MAVVSVRLLKWLVGFPQTACSAALVGDAAAVRKLYLLKLHEGKLKVFVICIFKELSLK